MAIVTATITVNGKKYSLEQATHAAQTFLGQKKFSEAENIARAIVKNRPDFHAGLQLLGVILGEQGKCAEAVKYCEAAIATQPGSTHQYNTLGIYLAGLNELDRAEAAYQESLRLQPDNPDAAYNLGKLFLSKRQYEQAEHYLQQSLASGARGGNIYYNLGACAHSAGNYSQAILWFKLAYNENEKDIPSLINIGLCYQDSNQHQEAIEYFEKALALDPEQHDCLLQLAVSYLLLTRHDTAEKYLKQYLALPADKVDEVNALMTLSGLYKARGDSTQSIKVAKEAVEKYPEVSENFSNVLLDMVYSEEVSQEELFSWCKKYAEYYEAPYLKAPTQFTNAPIPNRKLRIGYISADFFNHAVSYFALPLVCNHHKESFEVYTYAVRSYDGAVSKQYKKNSHWVSLIGMNAEDIASRIQADQIDILVDLAGHTGGNQLRVFARRAAPIQVTWLGYPFTTGLSNMDYRIVDSIVEPDGLAEHLSTEKLVRIPGTFCAYRPSIGAPARLLSRELDVRTTPAKLNDYITFGCCNNIAKLTNYTLALWARIMHSVPTAKLLLEAPGLSNEYTHEQLYKRCQQQGLPMERVTFINRAATRQYSLYHQIDIALDPYPCNGGTTTCDALFMSVPVVSLSGTRFMSRMGATFLTNVGHPEWVTESPDEYVEIAVRLASDVERLDQIRQRLRTEVEQSPLMDETGFARKMERAYKEMWKTWCLSQPANLQLEANQDVTQLSSASEKSAHLAELYEAQAWEDLLQASLSDLEGHDSAVHHYYGVALWKLGHTQEAFEELLHACSEQPDTWQYFHVLADYLQEMGEQAVATQMQDCLANPANTQLVHYPLAAWMITQAKGLSLAAPETNRLFNQAIGFLQHLLEFTPSHTSSWVLLADAQLYRNQFASAEMSVSRALRQDPNNLSANLTLAKLLIGQKNFSQAESLLLAVVKCMPAEAEANYLLAQAYEEIGNLSYALEYNLAAIEKAPEQIKYWSQWIDHAQHTGVLAQAAHQEKLQEYCSRFGSQSIPLHNNTPDPQKKIRLGICSNVFTDEKEHTQRHSVLANLDRSVFETFYYFNGTKIDDQTEFLREQCADYWHFTFGLSAKKLAKLIMNDKIDILLDLSGHSAHNFAEVIAQKPAPVIVNWSSPGHAARLPQVDYSLTDSVAGVETWGKGTYEHPWVLHDAPFISYVPFINHPERHSMSVLGVKPSPCLERGYITFGSACDTVNLTADTLSLWAKILLAVPGAKMLLKNQRVANIAQWAFKEYGILANRVQYAHTEPTCEEFLYQEIDIVLDTTPHNQLETSLNSLWMGAPVVTLAGEYATSRIGASILSHLGHPEWIAETQEQFVNIIKMLCSDHAKLNDMRQQLRPMLKESKLMDMTNYVQSWQAALIQMWAHWCQSPASASAHEHWSHTQALELCDRLLKEGQTDKAWEGYKSILAHWPDCAESLYGLGMIILKDNPEQGKALLERAAHGMPTDHPKREACLAGYTAANQATIKH